MFDFATIVAKKKCATKHHAGTFLDALAMVNVAYETKLTISTNSVDWATLTDKNSSLNERYMSIGKLCLPFTREALAGGYSIDAVNVLIETWSLVARSIENRESIPVEPDAATAWMRSVLAKVRKDGSKYVPAATEAAPAEAATEEATEAK
jgi:hypothetical protein